MWQLLCTHSDLAHHLATLFTAHYAAVTYHATRYSVGSPHRTLAVLIERQRKISARIMRLVGLFRNHTMA